MYSPINEDVEWGGQKGLRDPTYVFAEAQVQAQLIQAAHAMQPA